ncbi:MAG: Na/Pi cotransporter family protein, partial [Clostridia bacterium]|nr:Na/Pi cotransporter family protein [Clostridia bacterium]
METYIFNVLAMIGGLCLFLFGMNIMGQGLELSAGSNLRNILTKLTNNKLAGFFTGLVITSIIQSSSATTVMVVGFVNSGLLTLGQSVAVIIGANVGTTVTSWILSLAGIGGDNFFVQLLKPSSFTPVLALIGIVLYMFIKSEKKNHIGLVLLGFATLMYGMEAMSDSVGFLKEAEWFRQLFIMFEHPILGILAGTVLTAVIQSSSASVGILQALAAATGRVSYGAALPIIMGMNIGTCITAMISSVGANKNGKRAALIHLSFNVIGTAILLVIFYIGKIIFAPALLGESASYLGIAVAHTAMKIICTVLLLPATSLLEKISYWIIPLETTPEKTTLLDERLFATPAVALERSHAVAIDMAKCAVGSLLDSIEFFKNPSDELAKRIRDKEEESDKYEDALGSYLVKLSTKKISAEDSREAAMLLKLIGDFERISDHSVNIVEAKEEMLEKKLVFTPEAQTEINTMIEAIKEILELSLKVFVDGDMTALESISPLEDIIDSLKETLRTRHIMRLQQGNCSIEAGFVWSDLITDFERTSDHCSNIAGCIIDFKCHDMNIHQHIRALKSG